VAWTIKYALMVSSLIDFDSNPFNGADRAFKRSSRLAPGLAPVTALCELPPPDDPRAGQ
jgi:hypothetical protein